MSHNARSRAGWLVMAGIALVLALVPAITAAKRARQPTYCFLIHEVKMDQEARQQAAPESPATPALVAQVRGQLARAIASHERLRADLPDDAPDPEEDAKAFARYLKRRQLQPYRVNVEITRYSQRLEPMPEPRRGRRLVVSLALRTFGETIPKRVIAFSGDGSATIKLDIGKRLRARDVKEGNRQALELAIADALALSVQRLDDKRSQKKKGSR